MPPPAASAPSSTTWSAAVADLYLMRHGVTGWNREGRIQGQSDIALAEDGARRMRRWQLPDAVRNGQWHVSPLLRARQSATCLGVAHYCLAPALVEMDWGRWSGRKLAELRAELGQAMAENERRGLDFRPDGGESPRDVRARLARWLAERDPGQATLSVITHKGVIRAAISLATGWDLVDDYGEKLARDAVHHFRYDDGRLVLLRLNQQVPLAAKSD